MEIITFPLGSLSTNCYLVFDDKSHEAVIIDPPDAGDFLTTQITDRHLTLRMILATHGHFDHVLAGLELKLNFKAPFLMSKNDEFLLSYARKRAIFYTHVDPGIEPTKPDKFLEENDIIKIGTDELKVIETPGHSPGSICLYCQKQNLLLSGDTIFKKAVGRTDLPQSSLIELESSIKKLLKLPDKTIVYPGHGDKTTISEFKQYYQSL